ncbi:hypothetical protein KUTeg_008212, partial [Tegillarca granosa]
MYLNRSIYETLMDPKLSLVATFDDLIRNARVLQTGIEPEFKQFVHNQEDCRLKWFQAECMVEDTAETIKRLTAENSALQTRLKHARSEIEKEIERRQAAEQERDQLKSKFEGSPKRLTTINESTHSLLSESYFDKTDDDLIETSYLRSGRKWKRPSAPPMEEEEGRTTPPKRRRSDENDLNNSITTKTTVTLNSDGKPLTHTTEVTSNRKLNKSFSEPALDKHNGGIPIRHIDSDPESEDSCYDSPRARNRRKSKGILKQTPETPGLRKAHSASKGLNRVHFFISKTVIKPESCIPCGKRIKFGKLAMKCKDCRAVCHPECKDNLPLPCIPNAPSTPGTAKFSGGVISDFTPLESPMIPAIVVHCVNEVEARGLNEVGIYRVPGSDSQVKELKKEFLKGRGVPNLSHYDDIHVVCGCLKLFLRSLKEPLVTYKLWRNFVNAAENRDSAMRESEFYQVISQLPQPNRDTLAFLILHLVRVGECVECKMPLSNLCKVFGPTIVGYSVTDPEPLQMINETKYQTMVLEGLVELPLDYWESFLNIDTENLYPNQFNTPKTPDSRAGSTVLPDLFAT